MKNYSFWKVLVGSWWVGKWKCCQVPTNFLCVYRQQRMAGRTWNHFCHVLCKDELRFTVLSESCFLQLVGNRPEKAKYFAYNILSESACGTALRLQNSVDDQGGSQEEVEPHSKFFRRSGCLYDGSACVEIWWHAHEVLFATATASFHKVIRVVQHCGESASYISPVIERFHATEVTKSHFRGQYTAARIRCSEENHINQPPLFGETIWLLFYSMVEDVISLNSGISFYVLRLNCPELEMLLFQ